MMPKGVEHIDNAARNPSLHRANQSMMPKGVEHFIEADGVRVIDRANQSMMPKGVEHYELISIGAGSGGKSIYDAERR